MGDLLLCVGLGRLQGSVGQWKIRDRYEDVGGTGI